MLQPKNKDGVNGTGNGLPLDLTSGSTNSITPKAKEHSGYTASTSPLPNTANKGNYEKTIDKTRNMVILRGGDKKEISRARIGSKEGDELVKRHEAKKADTKKRRDENFNFLQSRELTGKVSKGK